MSRSGSGSGRRDFSEQRAKLEKHIERLPDYAQRAQEKLHRYFPPEDEGDGKDRDRRSTGSRSADTAKGGSGDADGRSGDRRSPWAQVPRMPAMPPMQMPGVDAPVVADVRSKWAQWNAPEAKHQRRITRTSRALTLWIVLALLSALVIVVGLVGMDYNSLQTVVGGIAGMIVTGTFAVRSGMRLNTLKKAEIPAATTPPPLPAKGSSAREPLERLAESEAALSDLLAQLSNAAADASGSVPEVSVSDARKTADEAAAALRGIAGRIQAIERGRAAAPERERGALDSAVATLREQLDDGLEGYGTLVAAAGRAVAASSGGVRPAKDALTDATDHLAGLAIALRELS